MIRINNSRVFVPNQKEEIESPINWRRLKAFIAEVTMRCVYLLSLCLLGITSLLGCSDGSDFRPTNDNDLVTPRTDCFWIEYDKEKYNFGQNDTGATVWLAAYALPETGTRLTIEGAFPYARFMSLITYRLAGGTLDALADRDILADSGSINPFVEGNPRNDPSRRYHVTVAAGPPPVERDSRNDNVLYGGPSEAGSIGVLAYRVYVPN
ncbi:MAG: hypothetical protein EHM38_01670, partial [Geobacteraceae bacterium]